MKRIVAVQVCLSALLLFFPLGCITTAEGPDFSKCDIWLNPYNESEYTRCIGEESNKFPEYPTPDINIILALDEDRCSNIDNQWDWERCLEQQAIKESPMSLSKPFRPSSGSWKTDYEADSSLESTIRDLVNKPNQNVNGLSKSMGEYTCISNSKFVMDVSIPDDAVLRPGERFKKTWRLENIGTCTWEARYSLFDFQNGSSIALSFEPPIVPETLVDVSLDLQAPWQKGTYTKWYQMQDASGQLFGDKFYCQIVVDDTDKQNTLLWLRHKGQTFTVKYPVSWELAENTDDSIMWNCMGSPTYGSAYLSVHSIPMPQSLEDFKSDMLAFFRYQQTETGIVVTLQKSGIWNDPPGYYYEANLSADDWDAQEITILVPVGSQHQAYLSVVTNVGEMDIGATVLQNILESISLTTKETITWQGYTCDQCIKGNISYTGEKIYHFPGCEYYEETVIDTEFGERWFSSESEAWAAGWRKAMNCP